MQQGNFFLAQPIFGHCLSLFLLPEDAQHLALKAVCLQMTVLPRELMGVLSVHSRQFKPFYRHVSASVRCGPSSSGSRTQQKITMLLSMHGLTISSRRLWRTRSCETGRS